MSKRKHTSQPEQEVPMGIVAVFFVIALVVAFAKLGSGSTHRFANNPPPVRVV